MLSLAPRVSSTLVEDEMRRARTAIGAYEICQRLSDRLGRRVSPNSIYRILKALEEAGQARRVALSREWLLSDPAAQPDVLLVCDSCATIKTVAAPADVDRLGQLGREAGFRPERLVLEVMGRCAGCQGRVVNG